MLSQQVELFHLAESEHDIHLYQDLEYGHTDNID